MDRLESMLQLQVEAADKIQVDPRTIHDLEERVQYFKDMILAAMNELHEALDESSWKPWKTEQFINENEAFGELRDAWQFIMNAMFVATGMQPRELADKLFVEHARKIVLNIQRVETGEAPKCPQCKRALDEIEVKEVRAASTQRVDIHCVCGVYLGSRAV